MSVLTAIQLCAGLGAISPFQSRNFTTWLDAVTTHTPGERDSAAAEVAPWSLDELDALLSDLRRQPSSDQVRIVERALVLHTDVAVLNRGATGYNLPGGEKTVTLFDDGRAVGQMSGTVHWEFGRRLVDRLPETSAERRRVGQVFYRASAAVLQLWGEYPELVTHLNAGRRALGEDPVLLMYEGTMRQAFAGARVQRYFDERRRALARQRPTMNSRLPPGASGSTPTETITLPAALPSVAESRADAARLFQRALAIDPSLVEARIRLAHVRGDAGRHDQAAAELARATAGKLPPFLDYYAALLTGREARARGQIQAAEAAFQRASAIHPGASAPNYGLSEIAIARNDSSNSLSHLLQRDKPAASDVNDPWWSIEYLHEPSALALLGELRRLASP